MPRWFKICCAINLAISGVYVFVVPASIGPIVNGAALGVLLVYYRLKNPRITDNANN